MVDQPPIRYGIFCPTGVRKFIEDNRVRVFDREDWEPRIAIGFRTMGGHIGMCLRGKDEDLARVWVWWNSGTSSDVSLWDKDGQKTLVREEISWMTCLGPPTCE